MVEELFSRIKKLECEIKEAKDRSEVRRMEVEKSDESLRLYLTSVPLFVLGAALTSVDYSSVALPTIELTAWIVLFLSFISGLLQHSSSSLLSHDAYDSIIKAWDKTEARQKISFIEEYIDIEENEKVKDILSSYLESVRKRSEELENLHETKKAPLILKHEKNYEYISDYGGIVFIICLIVGFILLLISRSASL